MLLVAITGGVPVRYGCGGALAKNILNLLS
jgi:hypothetical protein